MNTELINKLDEAKEHSVRMRTGLAVNSIIEALTMMVSEMEAVEKKIPKKLPVKKTVRKPAAKKVNKKEVTVNG